MTAPPRWRSAPPPPPLDHQRAIQVTRVYTAAFFDTFLRGVISPLLSGPTDAYPEVRWHDLVTAGELHAETTCRPSGLTDPLNDGPSPPSRGAGESGSLANFGSS